MTYNSLRKLYYIDRNTCEQEYQARIHGVSSTILDFHIHDFPAFFVQTEEMSDMMFQIMTLDKRVAVTRMALPNEAIRQYYIRSMIEEVHQSLSIEKIYSTRKEIAETYKAKKEDRLLGMITKYNTLLSQTAIPLQSCHDIRQLYDEICLPEVKKADVKNIPDGVCFRKQPVYVYSQSDKVIHTGLFPETAITSAMDKALRLLENESINLLNRTAIFHYLFGYIHPFYDGNGRLARFITSYLLSQNLDSLIGVRLSYTINESKSNYYKMFKTVNDPKNKGDLTPFILGFLEILLTAYTRLAEALTTKLKQMETYLDGIERVFPEKKHQNIAFLLLQVSLFGSEGITLQETVNHSGVGYTTVKRFFDSDDGSALCPYVKDGHRKLYNLDLDVLDKRLE